MSCAVKWVFNPFTGHLDAIPREQATAGGGTGGAMEFGHEHDPPDPAILYAEPKQRRAFAFFMSCLAVA